MKLAFRLALIACLLLGMAGVLPAGAQVGSTTRYDMHPLIQLHATGADFVGQPFQADVFLYRGGPAFFSYKAATGNASRVASGVATPEQLAALNQALAQAQVGRQTGHCGSPAPDYVAEYDLTWYGRQRVKTIPAGGDYSHCPAEVVQVFQATCEFIWDVLGPSPEICVPPNP
jgi:hypothetical protein